MKKIVEGTIAGIRLIIDYSVIVIMIVTIALSIYVRDYPRRVLTYVGFEANGFKSVVEAGNGLVITATNVWMVQKIMRRGVLLAPLDIIAYLPELTPLLNDVTKSVYGFDLLDPPKNAYRSAGIPHKDMYSLWAKRSRSEWIEIRRRYGVTGVIIRLDATLDLPLVAANPWYRYYEIPQAD